MQSEDTLPSEAIKSYFQLKLMVMKQLIENSATKNYLFVRFEFLLRTEYPHSFRMSWRIIKRSIVPWIMNIGVASCPQSSPKIIGKGHQPKSIILYLLERNFILTMKNQLGFRGRRRLGLVSSTIIPT